MACLTDISKNIAYAITKNPKDYGAYEDMLSVARLMKQNEEPKENIYHVTENLRRLIGTGVKNGCDVRILLPFYKEALHIEAIDKFDSYLLYLEFDREPSARFYQPRRRVLYPIVNGMQDLVDDKLDELFISQPPRTGKTTLLMMFVTWIIGRESEKSNLYAAYSDNITNAFYNGVLEIITDPVTYNWKKVFPSAKIAATNSKEETINIDRRKRYPSQTCRSIYGTLNGSCDCNGMLISDDLVCGIEDVLNPDRMIKLWNIVDNNFLTRKKEKAKVLWCGTRWSMIDPVGKRLELLESDHRFSNIRYKVVNLPATNENGESNFVYDFGVGFSTDYFEQRRASFERNNDLASWDAQYMQQPIEREGTLFTPSDFRYFNGNLPDAPPDRIFMAIDPSFGGGDFVAAPVCFQYENDIYVVDAIYNNGDKRITVPLIVNAIKKYDIAAVQVEANKATEGYKTEIENRLKEDGIKINLTTKPANTHESKLQRIYDRAPDIRDCMIFLEPEKRERYYEQFMQNVFGFKVFAKKQHDDAPDSLAQAIEMTRKPSRKIQIFSRTF